MLAACLGVLGLAGCGKEAESGTKQEKVRLMVWSPSEDQSKESGEWLQTMCESFAEEKQEAERYTKQAEQASRSFVEKFWMPEKSCLKDVISGTYADEQIRCNQIWAVSMPFSILDGEKERQIVETVFEKLYTSYGLRTLEEADEQFHPVYEGEMKDRDMAYHQGTVWTFPLGAYYLAYLKVYNYSETAKQTVTEQLEIMESALREGCIGQLPEIYDGKNPVSSKGCFAQAWSVGEILRVYEQLEKNNNPSACKR